MKQSTRIFWLIKRQVASYISIIVNERSEISSLNAEQVKRIFLCKQQLTEQGDRWIPINLSAHNVVRKSVTEQFLQFTSFELERYWDAQYFNGVSPPYVLASEEAVLRFVIKSINCFNTRTDMTTQDITNGIRCLTDKT